MLSICSARMLILRLMSRAYTIASPAKRIDPTVISIMTAMIASGMLPHLAVQRVPDRPATAELLQLGCSDLYARCPAQKFKEHELTITGGLTHPDRGKTCERPVG